jgi:hypothetical protein
MICLADVNILNSALNSCGLLDRIWANMLGNGESESGYQLFVKRFGGLSLISSKRTRSTC